MECLRISRRPPRETGEACVAFLVMASVITDQLFAAAEKTYSSIRVMTIT